MSFAKFFSAFFELSKISKQMSITKSSNWERQREREGEGVKHGRRHESKNTLQPHDSIGVGDTEIVFSTNLQMYFVIWL